MIAIHAGVLFGDRTGTREQDIRVPHEDEEATDIPAPLVILPAEVHEIGKGQSKLTYEEE